MANIYVDVASIISQSSCEPEKNTNSDSVFGTSEERSCQRVLSTERGNFGSLGGWTLYVFVRYHLNGFTNPKIE